MDLKRLQSEKKNKKNITQNGQLTLKGLFIPIFIEQILMNMMGTVNTLMLGNYADDAVAAVGAANQVNGFIFTFFAVISGGCSVVISHRLGSGDKKEASDAAFSSMVLTTFLSLIVGLGLSSSAYPIMRLMQLSGDVLDMAVSYFRVVMSFAVIVGMSTVVSAILRSYGKPKLALSISLSMNLLNVIFNYFILYGPFELRYTGATGIAVANVCARTIALIIGFVCLIKSNIELDIRNKNFRTLKCIGRILRIGVPGGVSNLSYSLSQVVSTSILAVLGTTALTAKIYISSIVFYVYVVGYSLGLATEILVGWMIGAGDGEKAYRLNQNILKFAVSLNVVLSLVIYVFHKPLMGLFTKSPEIIEMTGIIFLIDVVVEFGRAFNHIENNSLNGAGDVVFPMIVSIISAWGISILFSYILGAKLGYGLAGCWVAFAMDECFRGFLFFKRFRSKKWMRMKV